VLVIHPFLTSYLIRTYVLTLVIMQRQRLPERGARINLLGDSTAFLNTTSPLSSSG